MASKRPVVVGGNTPGKPASERSSTEGTSRKCLFSEGNEMNQMNQKGHRGKREWTDAETSALVQYICMLVLG